MSGISVQTAILAATMPLSVVWDAIQTRKPTTITRELADTSMKAVPATAATRMEKIEESHV